MLRPTKRRLIFRTVAALAILAATLCGRFLYGIHAENLAMQTVALPPHELPPPGASVLVVAPHCDDETLGVGGLISEATRRGCRVTVAFVTNGDGFPMAVSREVRRWPLRPEDYQRMACRRQEEARLALARLGVPQAQILFLGYPDGGVAQLWNRYWTPDEPFRSPFTGCSASPYPNSYGRGSVYCGRDLMQDLETLLARVRPQWLYIPHPGDDHPDHWATHCFAVAALEELRSESSRPVGIGPMLEPSRPRVYTYLVHRGDWPVPQGLHRDARLVPPAPMARLNTSWSSLSLSAQAEADKEGALLCYRSQTAVMNRFLTSFIRRDELLGTLPPAPLERGTLGRTRWQTAIADTTRDTLIRGLEGSGDFTAVEAGLSGSRLRLRVTTRRPLSPRLSYTVRLHPLGEGAAAAEPLTVTFRRFRCDEPVATANGSGRDLEISVPLAALGNPTAVLVGADSRLGQVPIDRVSWRLVRLPHEQLTASTAPSRR
jgi:LmbE family N-acetylglucosaminyl deacetylase